MSNWLEAVLKTVPFIIAYFVVAILQKIIKKIISILKEKNDNRKNN